MSHPVALTSQNKKAMNAEKYHLLQETIQAFLELVQTTTTTHMKMIKLCSVETFGKMMKFYKDKDMFEVISPTIEDDQ